MENLPKEIRKQLGYIIRENRLLKLKEIRNQGVINNPFIKSNFCENNKVCHYNTLSNLENDCIIYTNVYYILLSKLGLSFNVSIEKHYENLKLLDDILNKLLKAVEFLDDELIDELKKDLDSISFNEDCISLVLYKLIQFHYNLFFVRKIEEKDIENLLNYREFFNGLPKGLLYHSLGIYYLNNNNLIESEKCLIIADEVYKKCIISKGVIETSFMALHFLKREYLELINLCIEMKIFFKRTENYKRLIHTYSYLTEYYLLINAKELAYKNYQKSINIIGLNSYLVRYEFSVHYNMGLYCINEYLFKEAYNYIYLAYLKSNHNTETLKAINILLFLKSKEKNMEFINSLIHEGQSCVASGFLLDQIIFKYFKFKYENNPYYRKYAIDKVLPALKSKSTRIDFVLLLYEDLYES